MSNEKIIAGKNIWVVRANHRGDAREPEEVKITKVGRKYFELDGYWRAKFNIETLTQDGETNYKSQCYLTLQEILDEREMQSMSGILRKFFNSYGKLNLSLGQLRAIKDIIDQKF